MKKLGVLALLLCVMFGTAHGADTVKIGLMGPMTGSWASEGQEMKQVLDLLAEELNAKGGIAGKKVEVVTEDDGGDPRTAALAAQRLATQGVVAVIGTYGSAVTEATQNIYSEAKIIQIANGSTAIRLSEKGIKTFFRTCPRDDEQAQVAAQTIQKLGVKKLAILHDNSTYAKGLADEAKALLQGKVEIVFFEALTPKDGKRPEWATLNPKILSGETKPGRFQMQSEMEDILLRARLLKVLGLLDLMDPAIPDEIIKRLSYREGVFTTTDDPWEGSKPPWSACMVLESGAAEVLNAM
ncbi:MAG: ABC transporter substrate-binding protein [Syntrophobacteraceae bacterium]|nr:ABC transporter substrate-binding protein [Syntrophobacteraceae bacterium]